MMRARIYYAKGEALKFTGALDVQSIWQRSLKRADLSVEYSQGFHPQQKIQLPFPLPLGFIGQNEIIDIWFSADYELMEIEDKLSGAVPDGIEIQRIEAIDGQKKSVASSASHADFRVKVDKRIIGCEKLRNMINDLLNRPEILRERNKKHYDLRPLIFSIDLEEETEEFCVLNMTLSAHPSKTGRPDEVTMELGLDLSDCDFERVAVHFEN